MILHYFLVSIMECDKAHHTILCFTKYIVFGYTMYTWRRGGVVITTAQFHSTKPDLRFCPGSNSACGMSEICKWWESLTMVPTGNKPKRLSLVNHTTNTIHHIQLSCTKIHYVAKILTNELVLTPVALIIWFIEPP